MLGSVENEGGESYTFADITGVVTSASDNLPVIGANVLVKGTNRGTATDMDGSFTIEKWLSSVMELLRRLT